MAIYEITLSQTFAGVTTINRWNYVSSGTGQVVTGSYALSRAFGYVGSTTLTSGSVLETLRGVQSQAAFFTNLVIKNLYSVSDFLEVPFVPNTRGALVQEAMPPFAGYGFRTNRVRSDIARGTKRFIGATEESQDSGVIKAGVLTSLQVLAQKMSDVINYDNGGESFSFTPAVCGKEEYQTPSGSRAYRYYATEAEQLANSAVGVVWQPYTTIRSQTSRQFGVGQ